jgi:hypothetical protein
MKVGVTGHQDREGIQWSWVKRTVRIELGKLQNVQKALSCLAGGADQVFAEAALSLSIPVVAVVPLNGYERFFDGPALANYRRLLAHCELVQLGWEGDPERAFFEAGKFVADNCDLLFAVWDGESAEGLGGTGDVVKYAKERRCAIVCINPYTKSVQII